MANPKRKLTATNIDQSDLITVLTAMKDAITALIADHNTLRTKLNADAGVTDANYAASTATAPSLNP
jgi:arsenate reductase-like glutaredoxin family protein